jgi:hypothetical protein
MKKTMIAATFVLASFSASASTFCDLVETQAKLAMTLRQYGKPLSEALREVKFEGVYKDIYDLLVMEAYGLPAFHTESFQENAITEFTSKHLLFCLQHEKRNKSKQKSL